MRTYVAIAKPGKYVTRMLCHLEATGVGKETLDEVRTYLTICQPGRFIKHTQRYLDELGDRATDEVKTYLAIVQGQTQLEPMRRQAYPHILVSYVYDAKMEKIDTLGYPVPNVMLDSGAHTVWTKGERIDLNSYIEWATAYAAKFPDLRVTNLDVIPGSHGRLPTRREITRAVKESVYNAEAIRAAGLRVIEVQHLFDPIKAFDSMIERRRPGEALGVGGFALNRGNKEALVRALGDACFARLRDAHGWDKLPPVHGFGVSVSRIGYMYPLASIDASSWVSPMRYGQVVKNKRTGSLTTPKDSEHGGKGRLFHAPLAFEHSTEILRLYTKREEVISRFWQDRGVHLLPEGPALLERAVA